MKELELFRKSLNLTRQEFAEAIKISKSLYEKVEKLKCKFPQFDTNIFFNSK